MTKCFKCGGTEIERGTIASPSSESLFRDIVFRPEHKIRFLAMTMRRGVSLYKESYACLDCGSVWSELEGSELRNFIREHCKE